MPHGIKESLLKILQFLINKLKTGENIMDAEGLLLGSGFALLIVLVGWADQITSKSKQTKEIEKEFLGKANLKGDKYKKIIKEAGSTEDSFSALVDFLYSSKKENVAIFEKIKNIRADLITLNKKYSYRFWILLFTSISLFASGAITFFLPSDYKFWTLFPNLIFIIIIFCNLIKTYNLENRYTKNIYDIMEEL